jgi:hypothetical protein
MPALDSKEAESLFKEAFEEPDQAQLPSTTGGDIAPSLMSAQPSAAPTQDTQSQLLNLWFASRTESSPQEQAALVDDDDEGVALEGMAMEFVPDSQISAADYLAPDDTGATRSDSGGGSGGAGGATQS